MSRPDLRSTGTPAGLRRPPRLLALAALVGAVAWAGLPAPFPGAPLHRPLHAQVEHPDDLEYPPLPPLEIPRPQRVVLDNGMVVMLLEDRELPLVRATALVRTGGRFDPANKVGLASVAGDVLRTGGTESLAADALDDYLETRAATIESSVDEDRGRVGMSSLAEDFPEVLGVFADVLRRPAFAEPRLEVALTQARAAVARQNDQPQSIVFREIDQAIYGEDSPYARVPTYDTLAAISRDDLVSWHERWFRPDRVVLGLVGDFDSREALRLVREELGDWEAPAGGGEALPEPPGVEVREATGVLVADKTDVTQANIALGHPGIVRDHPDFYAVQVLNQILSGSMTSRLFAEIRTRRGLAYGVFGRVGSDWDHPGTTLLWTSTRVDTALEAAEALLGEARAIRGDRPPTEQEVAEAKNAILSSFVFEVDSPGEVLGELLTLESYGYPPDRLDAFRERIDAVPVGEVRRAAREHLRPDRFAIVVVGPKADLEELSSLGPVRELDISIPPPSPSPAPAPESSAEKRPSG